MFFEIYWRFREDWLNKSRSISQRDKRHYIFVAVFIPYSEGIFLEFFFKGK